MGAIAKIATVILAITFMTFVTFFGRLPALRRTPIAFLHRVIWVYIPRGVLSLDEKLTSGRFTSSMARFGRFMMHDRHPTVMIFFILLLSVSEFFALPGAWRQITGFQQITIVVAIILPYLFLYLAASADPGYVTPETHTAHMSAYPYDFTLFHPGVTCRTCRLLKPARSKHCSVCKRCVARLDHHCIFINNCVGTGNAHWFFLLLLSTAILTLWGGLLALSLITRSIQARAPGFYPVHWWRANNGSGMELRDFLILWTWGIQDQVGLGAVGLLAIMTSPLVWGLLVYNLWNVWGGVTTNESLKWSDMSEDMSDGLTFKRRLPPGRAKNPQNEAAWTRWPVDPEQIVVRTHDGTAPDESKGFRYPGEGEWERVWKLRDVENLYDLGFWDNLLDIFAPGSISRGDDIPIAERRRGHRKRKGKR